MLSKIELIHRFLHGEPKKDPEVFIPKGWSVIEPNYGRNWDVLIRAYSLSCKIILDNKYRSDIMQLHRIFSDCVLNNDLKAAHHALYEELRNIRRYLKQ